MAYEKGWRANKKSGEIAWSDSWVDGGHFQQIKGRGPVDSSFDAEFSQLKKSGSDVDDDGAWVTLHQRDTMGATETAQELAAKWSAAGYDVRVQDLEGHDGVHQADIAVRKGSGGASKKKEAKYVPSDKIKQAVERVEKFEQNDYNIFDPADNVSDGDSSAQHYLDQYKLNLRAKEPKVADAAVK